MWTKRKLLIWGTTYPEFSKTYFETVCTGAIDKVTGRLVRIYPISLRYMREPFAHYQWIEAEIAPNSSDVRPESHKIKQDSIKVLDVMDSKDGWVSRSEWVLRPGNVFTSIEDLREAEGREKTSLGLVRPANIKRFFAKARSEVERREWELHRTRAQAQKELWVDPESQVRELRFRKVDYRVEFTCADERCKGHDMSVLDWGLYVLHAKMTRKWGPEYGKEKVLDHLYEITDAAKKDAYFFLGNTKAHPQNFMVVGVYHPPKPAELKPTKVEQQGAFPF